MNQSSSSRSKRTPRVFNGPAILAAMFRELDPIFRQTLYGKLRSVSPIIARVVEQLEFVYDDLILLEDNSLQAFLLSVKDDDLMLAWKMTSEPLRRKILSNLSSGRREYLQTEADHQPKVLRQRVVMTQMQIAIKARKMLESGKLRIKSRRRLPRRSA